MGRFTELPESSFGQPAGNLADADREMPKSQMPIIFPVNILSIPSARYGRTEGTGKRGYWNPAIKMFCRLRIPAASEALPFPP